MGSPLDAGAANPLLHQRSAGVLAPLSALRSSRNHGIGDFRDLYALASWAKDRGLALIQILPISPLSPTAPYPYSGYSVFGLDIIHIALDDIDEIKAPEVQALLSAMENDGTLEALRGAEKLDYPTIYNVKRRLLWEAYRHFRVHGGENRPRQEDFERFRSQERAWMADYALFSALKDEFGWERPWYEWPQDLQDRDEGALTSWRVQLEEAIGFYEYAQWTGHRQWEALQQWMRDRAVFLMGDLPIYIGRDSVDVWAERGQFDLEADGGAPPDYFNWLGQNWAAPLYNWERMKTDGYAWWKERVRYNARLFGWLRFDHFRGISEYWRIPKHPAILDEIERESDVPRPLKEYEKVAWFWPIKFQFQFREKMSEAEWTQLPEGERLEVLKHINAEWVKGPGEEFMQAILDVSLHERGTGWVVEDLGAYMESVYELRDRIGLPGMRVVQFFGYDDKGRANIHVDPKLYPENSLAMSDTHDLPPLREWVESLTEEERRKIAAVYGIEGDFEEGVLETLFACPARMVIVTLQTILGLGKGHRINTPGTVNHGNWTWRMPVPVEALGGQPFFEELIKKTSRFLSLKVPLENQVKSC
jgi:4-alpha-glucanotransferase